MRSTIFLSLMLLLVIPAVAQTTTDSLPVVVESVKTYSGEVVIRRDEQQAGNRLALLRGEPDGSGFCARRRGGDFGHWSVSLGPNCFPSWGEQLRSNSADRLVRTEYPHPCPLPARGRETKTLMPV